MTRVTNGTNYLASEFDSKEELIDAIICSSFIPFYCGMIPPKFRDEYFVDGGLSNNIPVDPENPTLKIQVCYSENHIHETTVSVTQTSISTVTKNNHCSAMAR